MYCYQTYFLALNVLHTQLKYKSKICKSLLSQLLKPLIFMKSDLILIYMCEIFFIMDMFLIWERSNFAYWIYVNFAFLFLLWFLSICFYCQINTNQRTQILIIYIHLCNKWSRNTTTDKWTPHEMIALQLHTYINIQHWTNFPNYVFR